MDSSFHCGMAMQNHQQLRNGPEEYIQESSHCILPSQSSNKRCSTEEKEPLEYRAGALKILEILEEPTKASYYSPRSQAFRPSIHSTILNRASNF